MNPGTRRRAWIPALILATALAVPIDVALQTPADAAVAISSVGASTGFSAGGSASTVTATVPAAAKVGDLLVISVTAERGLIPTLSGVNGLTGVLAAADGTTVSVRSGYKFLTQADLGVTVTATVPTIRRMAITAAVWRGVGSVDIATAAAQTASGGTETTPGITPSRNGSVLVGLIGHTSNASPWTATFTPGSGWTERVEVRSTHPSAANPTTYLEDRTLGGGAGTAQSGATATATLAGQRYFAATLALGPQTEKERRDLTLVAGVAQPDATNTGVLPDVARTTVNGNVTLSTAGQVYENKDVYGQIFVKAANVTIRNVRVRGAVGYTPVGDQFLVNATDAAVSSLLIEHVTIRPDVPHWAWDSGVTGHDFTLRFADISGTVDGVNVYDTHATQPYQTHVVIRQNYIHDLVWWTAATGGVVHTSDTETHNDAIQHQGGWGTEMVGNTLRGGPYAKQVGHWRTTGSTEPYTTIPLHSLADGGPYQTIPDRGTGTGASGRYNVDDQANLMLNDLKYNGIVYTTRNITFTDNWCYGGNISINGGGVAAVSGEFIGTFQRNHFDRTQGSQSTGGNNTQTISLTAWGATGVTSGAGTANANRYLDGAEINFRGD